MKACDPAGWAVFGYYLGPSDQMVDGQTFCTWYLVDDMGEMRKTDSAWAAYWAGEHQRRYYETQTPKDKQTSPQ